MTDTQRKWIAVAVGVVAFAFIGSQLLLAQPPTSSQFVIATMPSATFAPAAAPALASAAVAPLGATSIQPKITWSMTSINVILSPGESTSSDLTFTSSQKLTNVSLSVVPQIAPFVTVQPSSISSLSANQAQSVHLSIGISTSSALGTYDGTLQVKSGTTTFPQTVKIIVNVWSRFQDVTLGFTIQYPPSLAPNVSPEDLRLEAATVPEHDTEGLAPGEVYLDIFQKPVTADPHYLSHISNVESLTLLDGSSAVRGQRLDDTMSPLPGYDMYVISGATLYVVAGTYDGSSSASLALIKSVQQTFQTMN